MILVSTSPNATQRHATIKIDPTRPSQTHLQSQTHPFDPVVDLPSVQVHPSDPHPDASSTYTCPQSTSEEGWNRTNERISLSRRERKENAATAVVYSRRS
ncbi:hypothetical protein FRC18_008104 [Serendipita sp. 400]|nr:hypothetical protein FRC18_008104 [Serendipita sp. 400]